MSFYSLNEAITEEAFRQAMVENFPNEKTDALVYADWLDDNNKTDLSESLRYFYEKGKNHNLFDETWKSYLKYEYYNQKNCGLNYINFDEIRCCEYLGNIEADGRDIDRLWGHFIYRGHEFTRHFDRYNYNFIENAVLMYRIPLNDWNYTIMFAGQDEQSSIGSGRQYTYSAFPVCVRNNLFAGIVMCNAGLGNSTFL